MYYPLRFHPVFKDYIWGGRSLADLGKILPLDSRVAESWEISAHPNGVSVIANGPLAGISLPDTCSKLGRSLLGSALPEQDLVRFPLLIKLIDAHERLSVQVHPDDLYAARQEKGGTGKNEMWYVISAKPGAKLIAGVKSGVNRQIFAAAINNETCLDLLQEVPVQAGDVLNIPAGLVHAIGAGLVICEIQQNADTTYRVFDYNRRDDRGRTRPLQVDKALDVIAFNRPVRHPLIKGILLCRQNLARRVLVLNRYFMIEELSIAGKADFNADGRRFSTLTVIGGKGSISYQNAAGHRVSEPLFIGDSLLLPAKLSNWSLSGELKLISCKPALFRQDAAWLVTQLESLNQAEFTSDSAQTQPGSLPVPEKLLQAADLGLIALEPYPGN